VGLRLRGGRATEAGALGATLSSRGGRYVVTFVKRDGAAWAGGLNANDEILLLNGAAPTDETLRQALFGSAPGTALRLQVKHGAMTHDLNLTLTADPDRKYTLDADPAATAAQQRLLAKWLGK